MPVALVEYARVAMNSIAIAEWLTSLVVNMIDAKRSALSPRIRNGRPVVSSFY